MNDLHVPSTSCRRALHTTTLRIRVCRALRSAIELHVPSSPRRRKLYNVILPIIAWISCKRLAALHFWSSGKPRTSKMALLIGIRYWQQEKGRLSELAHKDTRSLRNILKNLGFDVSVMLDDEGVPPDFYPSKENILREIDHLVTGALPHDQVVFVYSGHGDQAPCLVFGEEIDGQDERIIDAYGGSIRDNELRGHLVQPLPATAKLFSLFDCCHSGTILDLDYNWRYNALTGRLVGPSRYPTYLVFQFLSVLDLSSLFGMKKSKGSEVLPQAEGHLPAIICFSAAKDDGLSYEQMRLGISFLHVFLEILASLRNPELSSISIRDAFARTCRSQIEKLARLKNKENPKQKWKQVPQLSSNNGKFNLDGSLRQFFD